MHCEKWISNLHTSSILVKYIIVYDGMQSIQFNSIVMFSNSSNGKLLFIFVSGRWENEKKIMYESVFNMFSRFTVRSECIHMKIHLLHIYAHEK